MKRGTRSGACTLAVLACAGLSGCADQGDAEAQWLNAKAQPVNLHLELDSRRARTRVITSAGGSITAVTADGTRYRLSLPADALLSEERISLIPVTSVRGLPFDDENIVAVHIEPDGLRLMKPATLRIDTPDEMPRAEQVAFAYSSDGRDAHLYPLKRNAGRVELPIFHFSGYGIARAAPDDPGRLALQRAASDEARLSARLAEVLDRERQRQLDGESVAGAEAVNRHLVQSMVDYYDQVLRPLMELAERDERMAECALNRYLGWEQQLQMFAVVPDVNASSGPRELARRRQEAEALITKILAHATRSRVARAVERCRKEQAFNAASEVLALQRQAQLLGVDSKIDVDSVMKEIERCLHFEVEFDSIIETKTPSGGMYHHVRAKVPVAVSREGVMRAAGPLEYVAFRASGNPKEDLGAIHGDVGLFGTLFEEYGNGELSAAGTRPSTFVVHSLGWNMNKKEVPGKNCDGSDASKEQPVVQEVRVTFEPGTPIELLRFSPTHAGEQAAIGKAIEALGMAVGGPDLIAEGRKIRVGGPEVTEETRWADEWAERHGDSVVSSREDRPDGRPSLVFGFTLKSVERGVWRVEFEKEDPSVAGYSASEKSHLIVRHKPI